MGPAKRTLIRLSLMVIPILFFASFVSMFFSRDFNLDRFLMALFAPATGETLVLTLKTALLSLVLSWVFAWGLVVLLRGRGVGFFRWLSVLPGMAYALFVLSAFRALGVQDRYSMRSVGIAWVLAGTAYLASNILEGLRDLDPRKRDALRSLGASRLQTWWNHDFHGTRVQQASTLTQQFWFYLTSFSLVMILSGGPPHETLEVAIFTSVRLVPVDLSLALALAVWQSVVISLLRWGMNRIQAGAPSTPEWRLVGSTELRSMWLILFFLAVLVFWKSRELNVLSDFLEPAITTFWISGLVVIFASIFSILCYVSGARAVAGLGSWVSPMILSLSLWHFLDGRTLPAMNVILLQGVLLSPWFARSVFPLFDRIRRRELDAARVFGAGPVRAFFMVEWPRIGPAVIRTCGLVFSLSLTEVTSVLLFSHGGFDTLASFTQNCFSRFRMDEAMVGVFLLLFLSMLGIAGSGVRA